MTAAEPDVHDRVIVRLGFRDQHGTVVWRLSRGRVQVVTDAGDCRAWPIGSVRKLEPR